MRIIAIAFCLALLPAAAGGQQSPRSATAGPTVQSAAVGFRATTDDNRPLKTAQVLRRGAGQDVALMVVGVGAMIAGAIIGDTAGTIILIGGAAMALYGLYNYLE
ncbi:MAG TPA: hypothetical protein VFS56_00660 [Gemmatimonadaceae bacterium]|nr:hypothetical protein [Gemmatimonadaceae bacterium]